MCYHHCMVCPRCGNDDDKVIESRSNKEGTAIRRRRQCLSCGHRFTSYERIEEKPIMVIKKDGRHQPFDISKVERGIRQCTEKLAVSQEAIDTACAELIEAYNALAEHPFIAPGELALKINGQNVEDNAAYIKDELTNQVVITASYAAGAMVKSAVLTYENAENLTAQVSGNVVTVTKDNDAEYGSITVRYTVTDDYDRVSEIVRTIKVTDKVQMIESFSFVYNGQEVQSVTHESSTMVDLSNASVQLSVKTYPEAAEAYTDIQWSSNNSKVVVDQNGLVTVDIGIGDLATKTFTGTITCRITLSDGTVLSKDITVTFSRKY